MIYKGNPVSAGIAIGSAFVYDPKILTAPEDAPVLPMECELERYENAVQAAQAKLREIQAAFTGKDDDKAEIFMPVPVRQRRWNRYTSGMQICWQPWMMILWCKGRMTCWMCSRGSCASYLVPWNRIFPGWMAR